MPIKIPSDLPAHDVLRREGVMVMSEATALRQDIRPLQIALLNLMPNKVRTETQFARLIGATPLQIELTLIRITEHQPKNTTAAHLLGFDDSVVHKTGFTATLWAYDGSQFAGWEPRLRDTPVDLSRAGRNVVQRIGKKLVTT